MKTTQTRSKSTNVTLNPALLDEAKGLGINISKACEQGLIQTVSEEKMRRWNEENRPALEAWDKWAAENELPLAECRQF